jgi:hypothetical protein
MQPADHIAYLNAIADGCSTTTGDGNCDHPDCPRCDPAAARQWLDLTGPTP